MSARDYELYSELSDEHLVRNEPSLYRFGYVLDAFGLPIFQLEIEAADGITNSIFLDKQMLEIVMRDCLDALQELEVSGV